MKATFKGVLLAESDNTKHIEGNHYFPEDSINKKYFKPSNHNTVCPWKGKASYYDIEVEGETNENAAWYYPEPNEAAKEIQDHVAFWNGVEVE